MEKQAKAAVTVSAFETAQNTLQSEVNAALTKFLAVDPSFKIVSGYLQTHQGENSDGCRLQSTVSGTIGDASYHRTLPAAQ